MSIKHIALVMLLVLGMTGLGSAMPGPGTVTSTLTTDEQTQADQSAWMATAKVMLGSDDILSSVEYVMYHTSQMVEVKNSNLSADQMKEIADAFFAQTAEKINTVVFDQGMIYTSDGNVTQGSLGVGSVAQNGLLVQKSLE
jgi:hypothetical protein